MHSLFSNQLPTAFNNFLTLANEIQTYNTRYAAAGNYHVESIRNTYGHNSPSFTGNHSCLRYQLNQKLLISIKFKNYATNYLLAKYK